MSKTVFYTFLAILFAILAAPTCLFAQDFDQWRQQREREYQEFKNERDAAFLKMLQEAWIEIEGREPEPEFITPKLEIIPEAEEPGEIPDISDELPRELPQIPLPGVSIRAPQVDLPAHVPAGANRGSFSFYDLDIEYDYVPGEIIRLHGFPGQESLGRYWEQMSRSNYQIYLERLYHMAEELNLSDWGVLKITRMLGERIYGPRSNDVTLFVWFMMTRMGYDVKAGYSLNHVYVLFPSEYNINRKRFFRMNGHRYYVILMDDRTPNPNTITTYDGSYPGNAALFDLEISRLPYLPQDIQTREFLFQWQGREHTVTLPFNKNMIEFYRNFPAANFHVYTTAAISDITARAFVQELGPLTEGKSKMEAVNMLLSFVQTAFDYKTDTGQFGRQKYMLPEEILYYPYSDCDDRAILFAYLARHLLNAEVVGLLYPNHLAAAVRIDENPGGDTFMYNGSRYIVTDPTYIHAVAGMTMPQYRGVSPTIIPFFPD